MEQRTAETTLSACRGERVHGPGIPSLSARSRGQPSRGLAIFLLMLACLLTPREADALSCVGSPVPVVLAADCTDGVCKNAMALRRQVYRSFWCSHETRAVLTGLNEHWLPFPEIAFRLGQEVTSGVYEINTLEGCLHDMALRNAGRWWTDARARECRLQSSVQRISVDHGTETFAALRSDWREEEFAELIAALPTIVLASLIAKMLIMASAVPAIVLPWYLAHRVRWKPGWTTVILSAGIAGQLLLGLVARTAIGVSSDPFNPGGEAVRFLMLCLLALAAAIALQIGFLIARWGWIWLARLRVQRPSQHVVK